VECPELEEGSSGAGDGYPREQGGFSLPQRPRPRVIIRGMGDSVLIVDDDPAFRALAGRLLSACGFVVVGEADSIDGALETARRVRPSAALVDVGLPDGDGFALARQLTALPWQPRVVLTSMHPNVGSSAEVRRSGALAFVHKGDLPRAPLMQWFSAE
jgi:DNA-binding NarL/FixJ family response regulator